MLLLPAQTLLAEEPKEILVLQGALWSGSAAEDEVKKVNIRLEAGALELVTEDVIAAEEGSKVYDAKGGYVVGGLILGQPAAFLLVDGDPRQNPELLLDTKRHASFAVSQGRVLRNRLYRAGETQTEVKKRANSGWLGYTPPPIAMSTASDGPSWNQFDSKYASGVFIGALGLDRTNWQSQDDNSRQQVGNLNDFDGGEVRALRFGVVGKIKFDRPWIYTLFFATNAFDKGLDVDDIEDFHVYDARLDIPLADNVALSVGKQKEPISMERLMQLQYLPLQERPAFLDALLPARKIGVALSGTLWGERVTWASGVFNSWLDKGQDGGIDDNPTSFTSRITWLPYDSDNHTTTLHLGAAYRYSNARGGAKVAETPEFIQAPIFVETPLLDPDNLNYAQGEVSYRTGPFFVHSEYMETQLDGTSNGDLNFRGYQLTGAWVVSGEVRPYLRHSGTFGALPVSRGLDLNGWGTLELAGRYSYLDLSDGGIDGGEMNIWSLGLNWWLTSRASLGVNYRFIELDRFGIEGDSQGLNVRLMLQLL